MMKFGRIFAGFVMVCALVLGARAETTGAELTTKSYVDGAYIDLNDAKQEKLSNVSDVSGNTAKGVYVLTKEVDDKGDITLKWEKIERGGNQIRDGEM